MLGKKIGSGKQGKPRNFLRRRKFEGESTASTGRTISRIVHSGLATGDRRGAHRIPWRKKAMARRPLRSVASSPWRSASRAAAGSWASVRSRRGRRRSNNQRISIGVGPTRSRGAARAREERGSDRTEAGVLAREVEEARNARADPRTRSPARRSVPIPRGSDSAPTRRRRGAPTSDRTPRGTPP